MKTPLRPLSLAALVLLSATVLSGCERSAPTRPTTTASEPAPVEAAAPAAAPDAGAPLSVEQLSALVQGARACTEGETCALAGAGTCTCAQPVNASRAAEIDAAAARVECGGAVVRCANPGAARCEAGQCVGVTP